MCRLAILAYVMASKKYLVNFANLYLVGSSSRVVHGQLIVKTKAAPELKIHFMRNTPFPVNFIFKLIYSLMSC